MRQRMVGLGGTLQVESSVGKGTRVQARLPITAQPLAI
jgi:signal transduction histidine kinase